MVLLIPAQQSTAQSLGSPDDPTARKSKVHEGKSQHSHGIIDPLCINAWEPRHLSLPCFLFLLHPGPEIISRFIVAVWAELRTPVGAGRQ